MLGPDLDDDDTDTSTGDASGADTPWSWVPDHWSSSSSDGPAVMSATQPPDEVSDAATAPSTLAPEPPSPAPEDTQPKLTPEEADQIEIDPKGQLAPGNINPQGSAAQAISVGTDKGSVLVPTVSPDGKPLSNQDAVKQYRKTGKNLGTFATPAAATAYAKDLHENQETGPITSPAQAGGPVTSPDQIGVAPAVAPMPGQAVPSEQAPSSSPPIPAGEAPPITPDQAFGAGGGIPAPSSPDQPQPPVPPGSTYDQQPGVVDAVSGGEAPTYPAADAVSGGVTAAQAAAPDLSTPEGWQAAIDHMDPVQFAQFKALDAQNKQTMFAAKQAAATKDYYEKQIRDLGHVQQAAQARADAMKQVAADATRLAQTQIDPMGYRKRIGVFGTIASVIAATVGGAMSQFTGGRNLALEEINKGIDNDIAAQKEDLANQWKGIDARKTAIGEEFESHQDMNRAEAAVHLAGYQQAINQIDNEMQNYHPNGTTAAMLRDVRDQVAGAYTKQQMDYGQKVFDNTNKALTTAGDYTAKIAAAQKDQADVAEINARTQKILAALGMKGGGVPAGAPQYTVQTGVFDPFTKTPVMARTALKPEIEKELRGKIDAYHDEQLAWADLQAIAKRMDGHRGTAGQISKRFESTDGRDYTAARKALLVHKIKMLGERPNEQAAKNLEDVVPDLQQAFGAADTRELLSRAQARSDATFAGQLNTMGVDGDSVIANTQRHRAEAPEPPPEDEIASGYKALADAKTPSAQKDAQAAIDEAKQREAAKAADRQRTAQAIATATNLPSYYPLISDQELGSDADPKKVADATGVNETARKYNTLYKKLYALHNNKKATHDEIGQASRALVDAKTELDAANKAYADHWSHGFDTRFH